MLPDLADQTRWKPTSGPAKGVTSAIRGVAQRQAPQPWRVEARGSRTPEAIHDPSRRETGDTRERKFYEQCPLFLVLALVANISNI